ncbi:CheR family methyltransferase [Carnobacterium jeotgali]|uniref:CheR family methyltransferase n=1 Tax=Carnobacterium jeotgali TaxID=545534 RepID=UPI003890B7DA
MASDFTDIDETILARAKLGTFSNVEIKNVDEENREKYFTHDENTYYLSNQIKNKVAFKKHDLIGDRFGKDYNVIVCRNVTIYFKNEVKEELYQKFSDALVPGGLFFTGATETIYSPEKYGLVKRASFIYEKL